jgi:hypothetical protein
VREGARDEEGARDRGMRRERGIELGWSYRAKVGALIYTGKEIHGDSERK